MHQVRSITRACRTKIREMRLRERLDRITGKLSLLARLAKKLTEWSFCVFRTSSRILETCGRAIWRPQTLRLLIIVGTAAAAAFLVTPAPCPIVFPAVGELSSATVVSPISFKVLDEAATRRNRSEVLKSVRPVYDLDDEVVQDVLSRIGAAFGSMREYLAAEATYRSGEGSSSVQAGWTMSAKTSESDSFRALDDAALKTRFEDFLGARVSTSSFTVLKSKGFSTSIQADLRSLVVPVLLRGVVAHRDLMTKDGRQGILLRTKSKDKIDPLKGLSEMFDVTDAFSFINSWKNDPVRDTALSKAIRLMAMDLVNVNVAYNPQKSLSVRQGALVSVKPVYFQITRGESIIREGEPVNEGHVKKLLGLYRASTPYGHYMILAGSALVLVFLFTLCSSFSEKHLGRSKNATKDVILICFLFLGITMMVRFFASLSPLWSATGGVLTGMSALYAAPVAAGAMLAALRTNVQVGFVFAALISLTSTVVVHGNAYLFLFYFASAIVGLHGMTRIIVPTSIFRAGALVGLVNIVSILGIKMASGNPVGFPDLAEVGMGLAGGLLSGLLVSGLSPLLEPLGHMTNVKLVRIADLNHPLLKQMALEAPATYHHSMMVANLAETAAPKINASPLLARVGALYHDIGRVGQKSSRFQFADGEVRKRGFAGGANPSANVGVLLSHVERGVTQGKQFRLGQPIVDIIQQHHGTNRVKAIFASTQDRVELQDEHRYPGPRPQTKEAALVMLADAIETRWRTLPYPTPASTKKLVQTFVLGLLLEGQLDQSTLTLKDLEAITKSFTRTLQEIRHPRADYPARDGSRRRVKDSSNKKKSQRTDQDKYKASNASYPLPIAEMARATE